MKTYLIYWALVCFAIVSCQTPKTVIVDDSAKIENIKIDISQRMSRSKYNSKTKMCTARIRVLDKTYSIKNITYEDIKPTDGYYGVMLVNKKFKAYKAFVKLGDYNGRTIFVNAQGDITNLAGGNIYIRNNKRLFIIYHSDLLGFSIFNLKTGREETVKVDIDRKYTFKKCRGKIYVATRGKLFSPITGYEVSQNFETCQRVKFQKFIDKWQSCKKY